MSKKKVSLSSIEEYPSLKVNGVDFKIRRVTEPLRLQLRDALAEPMRKIQELGEKLVPLEKQETKTDEVKAEVKTLSDEINRISEGEIDAAWIKWGLVEIDSLEVDGVDITPANLRERGPEGLYREILTTIKDRTTLGGEEAKNSGSPTTS